MAVNSSCPPYPPSLPFRASEQQHEPSPRQCLVPSGARPVGSSFDFAGAGGLVVFVVSMVVVSTVVATGAFVVTSVLPSVARTGARDGRLSAAAQLCRHPLPSSSCAPCRAVAAPVCPTNIRDPVLVRAQHPSRTSGSERRCAEWQARSLSLVFCSNLRDNSPVDARAQGAVSLTTAARGALAAHLSWEERSWKRRSY